MTTFVNDNTGLNQDDNGNDRDDTRGDVVEVVKHGDSGQGKISPDLPNWTFLKSPLTLWEVSKTQ